MRPYVKGKAKQHADCWVHGKGCGIWHEIMGWTTRNSRRLIKKIQKKQARQDSKRNIKKEMNDG